MVMERCHMAFAPFGKSHLTCRSTTVRYSARLRRISARGEVAEWLKAHAWKVCVRETVPRVRIPLSPPVAA
jgi:hypothetical protein